MHRAGIQRHLLVRALSNALASQPKKPAGHGVIGTAELLRSGQSTGSPATDEHQHPGLPYYWGGKEVQDEGGETDPDALPVQDVASVLELLQHSATVMQRKERVLQARHQETQWWERKDALFARIREIRTRYATALEGARRSGHQQLEDAVSAVQRQLAVCPGVHRASLMCDHGMNVSVR
jgi:hypothetical protein